MKVFVIHMDGTALMPTNNRKARVLLRDKKAKIVCYTPFTIQLLYPCGKATQPINLGVDTGSKNIGIAVTTDKEVLYKGVIELRQDVKENLKARRTLRRERRSRKTRHRASKFLHRTRREGWLPPSIENRIDNHTFSWIDTFCEVLPKPQLTIEVGKFDIQKIENPDIKGEEYQQGEMYEYRNRIGYLLARESGTCQYCHTKRESKNNWRLHHIWGKDYDRPEDWALLHLECHVQLHANREEHILQKVKPKSYKESTFMNIVRKRLFKAFPSAKFTYGNTTFQDRCELGLPKTHYNDAIAITGIKTIERNCDEYVYIKQFRKKKRSLHESVPRKGRKAKNTTSKRNEKNKKSMKGICLNDKVRVFGNVGFVSGFDSSSVYVTDIHGEYITNPEKNYKQISVKNIEIIGHNNNWVSVIIREGA